MKEKDWNQVARVEKAIADKYGEDTITNPKHYWNDEKEKEYLEQLKELTKKEIKEQEKDQKLNIDGIFISKKLLNKDSKRTCPVCNIYSFEIKDDLYTNRFDCCFKCYVKWVEGREERWEKGWRPNDSKN
jgi:hypothetical protein